jgi:hypothetical protein
MAWDKLVNCKRLKLHFEDAEVVLIYEKTLVVVAYRLLFEVLRENNTEASIFYQVRPVAQTALVFIVIARREFPFFVRHFLCT